MGKKKQHNLKLAACGRRHGSGRHCDRRSSARVHELSPWVTAATPCSIRVRTHGPTLAAILRERQAWYVRYSKSIFIESVYAIHSASVMRIPSFPRHAGGYTASFRNGQ
jgi:hypothetical protein